MANTTPLNPNLTFKPDGYSESVVPKKPEKQEEDYRTKIKIFSGYYYDTVLCFANYGILIPVVRNTLSCSIPPNIPNSYKKVNRKINENN